MSLDNTSLVPTIPGRLSVQGSSDDDQQTRLIFGSFHEVFAAKRLPERAVFWMERNKFGGAILRHVRDLRRIRKSEDQLVARIPDDPDAARILIGNFAAGCKLSTVRWELYRDFELRDQLGLGRFDFMDLTFGMESEKIATLRDLDVAPVGDWDFDCIILFHRCPVCRRVFDKHSIIYNPTKACDSCKKKNTLWQEGPGVVKQAMLGYMERLNRIVVHGSQNTTGEFEVQHFIDPVPNSVMYWILATTGIAVRPDVEMMFGTEEKNTEYGKWVETMYSRSLFNFMASEGTRSYFRQYMERIHGECGIMIEIWRRIGELLRYPYAKLREFTHTERLVNNSVLQAVIRGFPDMINTLVVEHIYPRRGDEKDDC